MKACLYILLIFLLPNIVYAQYGGVQSYTFINLPSDAFTTSLGGISVAPLRPDPALFLNNPALQDSLNNQQLKLNFAPLIANTQSSTVIYNFKFRKKLQFGIAGQYLNFGEFQGTDNAGNITNNFKASAYLVTLSHAQKIQNLSMGVNLKIAGHNIENYRSTGLMLDFGGYFRHPKKDIALGLSVKNMGKIFDSAGFSNNEILPFDVQIGGSFKLEQMPIRFNINLHHLHNWQLGQPQSTKIDLVTGLPLSTKYTTLAKLFQHANFGIEALVHRHLQLNFGYNHLLRTELKSDVFSGFSGFSAGFLLKTNKIDFTFGRQSYYLGYGFSQFTLNLKKIRKN